jgi:hypothetical protein
MLLKVKNYRIKYQKTKYKGFELYRRAYGNRTSRNGVNVWGENHLWVRFRKGFNVSGLVEPEILGGDSRRIPVPR